MSIIGVYDYDFMNYAPTIPNLECAKLCSYHKSKREITILAPELEPSRYTKFFIRKDYNDGKYSKEFFNSNVEYGGFAFSKEKYIPMEEDIEATVPDFEVYRKYQNKFCTTKDSITTFNKILNGAHLRLSLDGENIWKNFEKQFVLSHNTNSLFFHDYDLNKIENSIDVIKDLSKRYTLKGIKNDRLIGMKFPVQLYKEEELRRWLDIAPSFSLFYLQYNGLMDNEMLVELCKKNKSFIKQLNYNIVCAWYDENDFFQDKLPKFYKQILFLRKHNIKILLTYDDNLFIDERIKKLIHLWNSYLQRDEIVSVPGKMLQGTLYRFCSSKKVKRVQNFKNSMKLEDMREAFQLVREKNYEVFKMFYEWESVKLEGGEFINDRL